MKAFKESFELDSKDYSIDGDWAKDTFNILKNGKITATVNRLPQGSENLYTINFPNDEVDYVSMGILFSVSWILREEPLAKKTEVTKVQS